MALRIEDYALIGDQTTAALVGRDGSIDWWCVPRFDSAACFAALLGTPEHGRWLLAPSDEHRATRRYRDGTLILESTFETAGGAVRITDFMPLGRSTPTIVRTVEGLRGEVDMRFELAARFGYGDLAPWTRALEDGYTMVAVGDGLILRADAPSTSASTTCTVRSPSAPASASPAR